MKMTIWIMKKIRDLFLILRKWKYSFWSNNKHVIGGFKGKYPVVFRGQGEVVIGENVQMGVVNSPNFYNSYAYIEPRNKDSRIIFENHISINNNFSAVSEKQITIKNHVLIGSNCKISDSNFHDLNPEKRNQTDPFPEAVTIGENVFIGNDVTILKGVVIGRNSVVGSNSVVTKSFPNDVIIAGNPAKEIGQIKRVT